LTGWPADFFYFVMCFVWIPQERDECSEEIARMRGLQEKYEAEMSQLAKDRQAASSFTWVAYGTVSVPKMNVWCFCETPTMTCNDNI
jgi:hypothetical protein